MIKVEQKGMGTLVELDGDSVTLTKETAAVVFALIKQFCKMSNLSEKEARRLVMKSINERLRSAFVYKAEGDER